MQRAKSKKQGSHPGAPGFQHCDLCYLILAFDVRRFRRFDFGYLVFALAYVAYGSKPM